eukprot:CAMPEP_0197001454 /NCGR_PEP_ID=MMETSP1380-20130617/6152_1 /TAXON_ID=5936 /ORGANISM="Euplotes crassus, Strain CT5" /LENGTH=236 /DNA_ID=CAMNT_0042419133 /DNA_START=439 /DNA_END=1149 /DNA_ORIENTATION=-
MKARNQKIRFSANYTEIKKETVLVMNEEQKTAQNRPETHQFAKNHGQIRVKNKKRVKSQSKNTKSQVLYPGRKKGTLEPLSGKSAHKLRSNLKPGQFKVTGKKAEGVEEEMQAEINKDSIQIATQNRSNTRYEVNDSTLDNTGGLEAHYEKEASCSKDGQQNLSDRKKAIPGLSNEVKNSNLNRIASQEASKPSVPKENLPQNRMKNLYRAYGKQSFTEAKKSTLKSIKTRPKSTL